MSTSYPIGVDIAKQTLHTDDGLRHRIVANQPAALRRWLRTLPPRAQLICEPSGGYERSLLSCAREVGVSASLINARHARAFARGLGHEEKTDRLDAAVLRRYGDCVQPRSIEALDPALLELQQLVRTRAHYANQLQRERNRLELLEGPTLRQLNARQCEHWKQVLDELDAQILAHVQDHERLNNRMQTLCLVCGVGPQTSLTLIAEFPELGQLNKRSVAKLAGLAPLAQESGQWQGRRHIAHGRAHLRRALFQAALVAARHNEHLKPFYQRLRANGKPPKVALVATARKLPYLLEPHTQRRRNPFLNQDSCYI